MHSSFAWPEVRAKAYHEAGHVVIAVVQGIDLAEGGMRIDNGVEGVARLCIRKSAQPNQSGEDQDEIEKSVIVLAAGKVAQLRFDPGNSAPQGWQDDESQIKDLVADFDGPEIQRLVSLSENLVDKHWQLIEQLARLLLGKPTTIMTDAEVASGWYPRMRNSQKCLSSDEIYHFFRSKDVPCGIRGAGL
jgi:hypothetical protein